MNKVSVIIPDFNGNGMLEKALECLSGQIYLPYEVIIVEDGGSPPVFNNMFPFSLRIITLKSNSGFACAVNTGIKAASGDFIALLNNDAYPAKDWLEKIMNAAGRHSECMSFASRILSYGTKLIDSAGDCVSRFGKVYKRGEKTSVRFGSGYCFGACAAASVYRAEFFNIVGMFDETYFMYYEDVDLNIRAARKKLKCWYEESAEVFHEISSSAARNIPMKAYFRGRNSAWILRLFPVAHVQKNCIRFLRIQCTDILMNCLQPGFVFFLKGKLKGLYDVWKLISL